MPNIKSAIKRVKVTETKNLQNRMVKSSVKTTIKKFDATVAAATPLRSRASCVWPPLPSIRLLRSTSCTRMLPTTRRLSSRALLRRRTCNHRVSSKEPISYRRNRFFFYLTAREKTRRPPSSQRDRQWAFFISFSGSPAPSQLYPARSHRRSGRT